MNKCLKPKTVLLEHEIELGAAGQDIGGRWDQDPQTLDCPFGYFGMYELFPSLW